MKSQILVPHRSSPASTGWPGSIDSPAHEGSACIIEIGTMFGISTDELLRRLADGLNDVFFCMDLRLGRWTYLSEGYERIWGRSRESLFADPSAWRNAIDPKDAPRVMQALETSHGAGRRYEIEFRINRPDGAQRRVRVRGVPVVDEHGTVLRVLGHAEDVSRNRGQDCNWTGPGDREAEFGDRAPHLIRVLVADGRPLIRHGLTAMLARNDGIRVMEGVETSSEALNAWRQHQPDVMLLDQELPSIGAGELLRQIKSFDVDARAILLGRNERESDVSTGLRAGARAFILPTTTEDEVLRCIRTVHAGRSYVPQNVAELMAAHIASDPLTARELEILRMVAQGQSNKQIANALTISESTVKSHVRRILGKTQASTRGAAAAIGLRRGLVNLAS